MPRDEWKSLKTKAALAKVRAAEREGLAARRKKKAEKQAAWIRSGCFPKPKGQGSKRRESRRKRRAKKADVTPMFAWKAGLAPEGPSEFTMPFGVHKGKLLTIVPTDYLRWMLGLPNLFADTRRRILHHLTMKCDAPPITVPSDRPPLV